MGHIHPRRFFRPGAGPDGGFHPHQIEGGSGVSGLIHLLRRRKRAKDHRRHGPRHPCRPGAAGGVLILQFLKDGRRLRVRSSPMFPISRYPQTRRFGFTWTLSEEEKAQARDYNSASWRTPLPGRGLRPSGAGRGGGGLHQRHDRAKVRLLALLEARPAEWRWSHRPGPLPGPPGRRRLCHRVVKRKHPFDQGTPPGG